MMCYLTLQRILLCHFSVSGRDGITGITSILSTMLLLNSVSLLNSILPKCSLTYVLLSDWSGEERGVLQHGLSEKLEETETEKMVFLFQNLIHDHGKFKAKRLPRLK